MDNNDDLTKEELEDLNKDIEVEQPNTMIDLHDRIKPIDNEKNNEILVTIDGNKFTQQDFQYIQQLSEILADSGEPAFHGELGNLIIEIFEEMNTYEHELIKITWTNTFTEQN